MLIEFAVMSRCKEEKKEGGKFIHNCHAFFVSLYLLILTSSQVKTRQ